MKTYVITLAKTFPAGHPRAGEATDFRKKFENGKKKHTIRGNVSLWARRMNEVEAGKACLSIREWSGRPYNSKQVEIARLTKDDGIGMQEMAMQITQPKMDGRNVAYIGLFSRVWTDGHYDKVLTEKIAKNDGLLIEDWKAWFKDCKGNCLAIIHFTPFRY